MEPTRRDEALSIISHELRNELSVLATWAALLRRSPIDVDRRQLAAAAIDRGTEIARRLCDDLGGIIADLEPTFVPLRVDLREIVLAGVRAISADARRKGLRVVQHIDGVPVWVIGDRVRLGEVVSNLLRNALAFTTRGDTITVEVHHRDGQAALGGRRHRRRDQSRVPSARLRQVLPGSAGSSEAAAVSACTWSAGSSTCTRAAWRSTATVARWGHGSS